MRMRFNHMELTLPVGALDDVLRKEIDDFYGEVFGWTGIDTEVVGQLCHLLLTGEGGDFILLAESDRPISSPGYDHLGLLQPARADVDELLERCRRRRERDDRVQIKEYKDLVTGDLVVHAFYVKYLLPIWFDVQCMERGGEPVPITS
jgi:glyoxalase/bleomycin resistance protein/dioxygenase superfamily protein